MPAFLPSFYELLWRTSAQATLLGLLILLVQWVLRHRLSARWRYNLWLLVLLRLALPFSIPSPFSLARLVPEPPVLAEIRLQKSPAPSPQPREEPQPSAFPPLPEALPAASGEADSPRPLSFFPLPFAIWSGGGLLLAIHVLRGHRRLRQQVRRAQPVHDRAIQALLVECEGLFHLHPPVPLLVTDAIRSPALFGLLRPVLLIPTGLLSSHSPAELRHIFLHELAHLRRRDLWHNSAAALLLLIHWWNPFLWLFFNRMRLDRELATDELALHHLPEGEARAYGHTIVRMLETFSFPASPVPSLAGMKERQSTLHDRLLRIAQFRPGRSLLALVGAVALLIILSMIGLSDRPLPEARAGEGQWASVEVKIVDDATGESVEKGEALALLHGPKGSGQPLQNGAVRLAGGRGSSGSPGLLFVINAPGYVPQAVGWHEAAPLAPPPIRLKRGHRVGGQVLDQAGKPAPGVRVYLTEASPISISKANSLVTSELYLSFLRPVPITDADGYWHCDHFPAPDSAFQVSIALVPPDGAHTLLSLPESERSAFWKGEYRASLEPGVAVEGKVVDATGGPVEGATITVHNLSAEMLGYPAEVAVSGSDGRYTLYRPNDHRFVRIVKAPGYASDLALVAPGSPEIIRLDREKRLRLILSNEQGRRVRDAQLTIALGDDLVRWEVKHSWLRGTEVIAPPKGRYVYFITTPDLQGGIEASPDDSSHSIVLQQSETTGRSRFFNLRVNDSAGNPVPKFSIELLEEGEGAASYRVAARGSHGRYIGLIPVQSAQAGWVWRISGPGFVPQEVASPRGFEAVTYTLEREGKRHFAGETRLPDGSPAEGALLVIPPFGRSPLWNRAPTVIPEEGEYFKSDRNGYYLISQETKGSVVFVVHRAGCLRSPLENFLRKPVHTLQPWSWLEIQVTRNGAPASGIALYVAPKPADLREVPDVVRFTTDADGRLHLPRVPPGDYTVRLSEDYSLLGEASLRPGEGAALRVSASRYPVHGRLIAPQDHQVKEWQEQLLTKRVQRDDEAAAVPEAPAGAYPSMSDAVRNIGSGEGHRFSRPVTVTSDGRFRLDPLPPGEYRLHFSLKGKNGGLHVDHRFTIPEQGDNEPLDLGGLHFEQAVKP